MLEAMDFIFSNKLDIFCLVESDLHGLISRYRRANPLTKEEIKNLLHIPGYNLFLPKTWQKHGQARIVVFAKEELQVSEIHIGEDLTDLPILSFLISKGKEKKTAVNFFYREFTGGVSGLADTTSQSERLQRLISHWKSLAKGNRDLICLGDANLCSFKWNNDDYYLGEQADMVNNYLLETNSSQLVTQYTRSEIVRGGDISRSCIDHCYSNSQEKVSVPEVVSVGDSDHLGIMVTGRSQTGQEQ